MLGNGVLGILSESGNIWERRVPLTPSQCARLLHSSSKESGVIRIVVQPSTKRVFHDALYEDVGCEVNQDLSQCGLIIGIKQPKLDMILPDRAYSFFSHTHKAQKENMPLLDKVLQERVSLYDYELIVGEHGRRLLAFGKFAGRAGLIDFLHGLGMRYLNLGYSTPFLSLGAPYMYSSLAAAKAAVISVGEEIATLGLPMRICPLIFVFTGSGNVSLGAQEIFKLLPHTFVDVSKLPDLFKMVGDLNQPGWTSKRVFQVYGCVVGSQDMVTHKDSTKDFDKADYYAHPEHYKSIFHEKVAPYASIIVNCMYWEKRYPRLLSKNQIEDLTMNGHQLVGICDITCDIGGSIEFVNHTTSIDSPFFRYDPLSDSYHNDMEGKGVLCSAIDILPTEFAKEASQHFGNILCQFIGSLASTKDIAKLPVPLKRACIAHGGSLTSLYEYIPRMKNTDSNDLSDNCAGFHSNKKYSILVSLSGHLFDQFLINEALDIIEMAGGSFRLVTCQVGQSATTMSYSEVEVSADDSVLLDEIVDALNSIANSSETKKQNNISLKIGKIKENCIEESYVTKNTSKVLIIGAGRVCRPAAEILTSFGSTSSCQWLKTCLEYDFEEQNDVHVVVASLFLKDAEEVIEGIPNAIAVQLDITNHESLCKYISEVEVVVSLLPPSCHLKVANACIQSQKHLVTASYIDDSMANLDLKAKNAGITILGEMGLDPGIDHMMAMKMIDEAHVRGGIITSFSSYCGGLPSPAAANNPLAYKFSWNPAGAIRAGQNPAVFKSNGKTVHVDGDKLYDSAARLRIPDFPAFALECLPNRNSLTYGELYKIKHEASTIFRGTLRYEGFSEIMATMAKIGFFDAEAHPILEHGKRTTFKAFLLELLKIRSEVFEEDVREKDITQWIIELGVCQDQGNALKTAKLIIYLGLHEQIDILASCKSPFDVTCFRMEEKLAYSTTEQDMVLLHHEVVVTFPDGRASERCNGTLLEFGRTHDGKSTSAMALTVGIPAAIGALLFLGKKIKAKGVIRPLEPEVYVPALDILQAYGFNLLERTE